MPDYPDSQRCPSCKESCGVEAEYAIISSYFDGYEIWKHIEKDGFVSEEEAEEYMQSHFEDSHNRKYHVEEIS